MSVQDIIFAAGGSTSSILVFEYYLPESGKWRSMDYSIRQNKFYALSDDNKLAIIPNPKVEATYSVINDVVYSNQLRYDPIANRLVYQGTDGFIYYEVANDTFLESNVYLQGLPYSVSNSGYEALQLSDRANNYTYKKIRYNHLFATQSVGDIQDITTVGDIREMSSVSDQQYGPVALTNSVPNICLYGITSYYSMPAIGDFRFIQSTSSKEMREYITIPLNGLVFKSSYPIGKSMWQTHQSNIPFLDIVYAGTSKYYGLSGNIIYTSFDAVAWYRVGVDIPNITYLAMAHANNSLVLLQYGGNAVVVISGID